MMEETGSIHSEDFLQPHKVEEKQTTNNRREGVKSNTSNGKMYFPTGSGYIVNAATGFVYPHKVGTIHEKQFWRVIRSITKDGVTDGVKIFYDSPDQYEMHVGVTINPVIKEKWRKTTRTNISALNRTQTSINSTKQTYTIIK